MVPEIRDGDAFSRTLPDVLDRITCMFVWSENMSVLQLVHPFYVPKCFLISINICQYVLFIFNVKYIVTYISFLIYFIVIIVYLLLF